MFYYVYKITNLVNGKVYIGKRRHKTPETDTYMGSGVQILSAIKKYGKDSFKKEILAIFSSNNESSDLEAKLVTRGLIESGTSYNMHEGGHGGFAHINNVSPEERINLKSLKEKRELGLMKNPPGGTKHWNKSSFEKVREQAKKNRDAGLCKHPVGTFNHSSKSKQKISLNNYSNTYRWVVSKTDGAMKVDVSDVQKYIAMGFQKGKRWKTSSTTGTYWVNNGTDNKLIRGSDSIPEGWKKGRIMNMMVRNRP
jgi:Putative endonuclease segE, GIY-YIG domain